MVLTAPAAAEGQSPVTFKATYKLYASGLEIAESVREVSKTGENQYNYRSESHTIGIAAFFHKDNIIENSNWKIMANKLVPTDYSYVRTRGKKNKNISVRFDWDRKTIASQVNDNKIELPLTDGMLDKLSYQYAIMHDLHHNQFPEQYTVADARKVKTYQFEKAGKETITTPLGDMDTVKINRIDDETRLSFWCAPELQYLPVKIEQTEEDGQVITTVIQNIEGL